MRHSIAFALVALTLSGTALAAPVAITVRGADGRPLAGAVVSVETPNGPRATPRGTYMVEQRDIAFNPHVLIVPVGATVAFPNRNRVRHHVYSFSKVKKIDLKLYGREETRTVLFDRAGVVPLGCNIHDAMSGFVFVTATPFTAQTDAAGRVMLADVPAGAATVRVWHPTLRTPGNAAAEPVTIAPGGLTKIFALRR